MPRLLPRIGWLGVLCLLATPAPAQTAPARDTSSPAQVDGIVSAAVDRLWAQNDDYWHHGDYPRIIALDRIITQADPQFIECYNTGAWLMWSSGRDADAQAFYALCVAHNPRRSAAYFDYGMFLFNHRKDYPAAIRVYSQDVKKTEGGLLDWRMLAHSYEKAGDWDSAVRTWQHIKTLWPHGEPGNPSSADVDDHNLQRALTHRAAAPKTGGAAAPKTGGAAAPKTGGAAAPKTGGAAAPPTGEATAR